MDTKKLIALMCIVECGSLSKAAEKLGYTQSGLTSLIRSLEKECGVSLLIRNWAGATLSPEGEALKPDIQALLDAQARFRRHLEAISSSQEYQISIATYTSMSVQWFSRVINIFRQRYPDTEIKLYTGTEEEIQAWLQSNKVDILVANRFSIPGTKWIPLYNDPMLVILPKTHPAAAKDVFYPDSAKDLAFLQPCGSMTGGYDMQKVFSRKSNVYLNTEDDAIIMAMVEQGVGFSVLSELSLRGRTDRVAVLPLAVPIYRELGILRKDNHIMSPALRYLISLLLKHVMRSPA